MTPVVIVENIHKSFGDNHVLRNFSMTLDQGENLAILGKSGSGKSVLIKCIINLIAADKGRVVVLDLPIQNMEQDDLDLLRAKVGFLFQSNALYDSMTVRENLEFPLRRHWNQPQREKGAGIAVMEALDDVGLAHTVSMMPEKLSGGMRKRIALARTLILKPTIILYDEPTTGLDPITAREISHLIVKVQKKYNASSIIISHDMHCINITANRVITEAGKNLLRKLDQGNGMVNMIFTDTTLSQQLASSVEEIHQTSKSASLMMEGVKKMVENIRQGEGPTGVVLTDSLLGISILNTALNLEEGTFRFNQNMEALKANFLFFGYFRKLEKKKSKEKEAGP